MIALRKVDHQSLNGTIVTLLEEVRFTTDKTNLPSTKGCPPSPKEVINLFELN